MSAPDPIDSKRDSLQTVQRAIAVLNLFRHSDDALGISAIARATGLKVTTAHRLVRTLVAEGFMEQNTDTERYQLGPALAALGQRALSGTGVDRARPVLEQLAILTGESASLATRHSNTVLVVLRSTSQPGLRFEHPVGGSIEMHASGMGKVLLAFGPDSIAVAVRQLGVLETFTPATIASPDALVLELTQVRATGYATNRQERYTGVTGIAAPIVDRGGKARYALGLQGPSIRLTEDRLGQLARQLLDAAAQLQGSGLT